MHTFNKTDALEYIRNYHALFDATTPPNPFASSAWLSHFIEQVATDEWSFLLANAAENGPGATLLYATPRKPTHFAAVSNYYTSLYSAIVGAPKNCSAAAQAIVRQIVVGPSRCAVVDLAPLDDSSSQTQALRSAFREAGWYVKSYFCFGNWFLPTAGLSFAEYMAQRPSQLRNTWARKKRKFHTAGGRLEIIDGRNGTTGAALDALNAVYAKSWKRPEPFPGFVPGWAQVCARNGWLRMGIAWMENRPIAAQFWFTVHQKAYIFKLAYDESQASWSAGTLLTAHLIEHSIEQDRVDEIDYLTGDDEYKKTWMSSRRVRIGLRACNPCTVRGLAIASYELLGSVRRHLSRGHSEVAGP